MFIMNGIGSLFEFAGGIGMFLYGMNRMADGMQKSAGGKMKSLLGYLTRNRFLAILVGALITAIIQSSGATTVMVVGFVNAGLMTLVQAVGVIMGANIGTTITAWIVSLGHKCICETCKEKKDNKSPNKYCCCLTVCMPAVFRCNFKFP